MYKDTVTVFNRTTVNGAVVWHPEILRNVDLNTDRSTIISTYGENAKDRATLHIRYSPGTTERIGTVVYVKPEDYTGASNTVTFRSGENFSFFWSGEYTCGDIQDSAYISGFFDYFNRLHDDVYAVSSVSKLSVIPHFEITGR